MYAKNMAGQKSKKYQTLSPYLGIEYRKGLLSRSIILFPGWNNIIIIIQPLRYM